MEYIAQAVALKYVIGIDFNDVDSTAILKENSLKAVIHEISSLKAEYFELGRELGVPVHELKTLQKQYGAVNFDQAFNDMVLLWLRGHSTRTWQTLVRAVDSKTGGNNHPLALEIAGRHRAGSPVSHSPSEVQQHNSYPIIVPSVHVHQRGQMKENSKEIEARKVTYHTTESDSYLTASEDSQEDTLSSDDHGLDEAQVDRLEPNSELTKKNSLENIQQNSRVMETKSACVSEHSSTVLLRKPSRVGQTESTLDLETQAEFENEREQNGNVLEIDTNHNNTVDPLQAESEKTVGLDVAETVTVVEHVKERKELENEEYIRPVNDMLPSSDDKSILAHSIDIQASATSLLNVDSSTSSQVESKPPNNLKLKCDINEDQQAKLYEWPPATADSHQLQTEVDKTPSSVIEDDSALSSQLHNPSTEATIDVDAQTSSHESPPVITDNPTSPRSGQELEDKEDSSPLTEKNLASVQEALWEGRATWYNLGLQLGLAATTLDAIYLVYQGDSDQCFTAALKEWLRSPDLHPSLSILARALRAAPVGLRELADQIKDILKPALHPQNEVDEVDSILTEDDIASVLEAVWAGRAKWYNLGLELGIPVGTLDNIHQVNRYVTDDCFRAALITWLRSYELHPSWSSMARALRAAPVGLGELADQIIFKQTLRPQNEVDEVDSILAEDDISSVLRALWEGRAKWYNLGLELGIPAGVLQAIQLTNHYVTDDCFRETLITWMRSNELRPSWSSLARALKAVSVGLGELADQEHFQTLNPRNEVDEVDSILTIDDLASVQVALWEGRTRWYNLGLELGIPPRTLDAIRRIKYHVTDDCLRETLIAWLTSSELRPSWSSLARALKTASVGLGELADQEHFQTLRPLNEVDLILTEGDIASVLRALWEGRTRWYNLGLELGIPLRTLDAIQQANRYVTDDCFRAALITWLRSLELHPSWRSLTRALRADHVGLGELADQIKHTLKQTIHPQNKVDEVDSILTEGDIASVQEAVWEARAKWYNLGLELGIPVGRLNAIGQNNRLITDACFRDTLLIWLRSYKLHPSWNSLARALRAAPVGLGELADQIEA